MKLFQLLWSDWDDLVPDALLKEWLQWRKELPLLSNAQMLLVYQDNYMASQTHQRRHRSTLELCISEWKIRQAAYTLL